MRAAGRKVAKRRGTSRPGPRAMRRRPHRTERRHLPMERRYPRMVSPPQAPPAQLPQAAQAQPPQALPAQQGPPAPSRPELLASPPQPHRTRACRIKAAMPGRPMPGRITPGRATPGRATPGRATPGQITPGRATPGRITLAGRTRRLAYPMTQGPTAQATTGAMRFCPRHTADSGLVSRPRPPWHQRTTTAPPWCRPPCLSRPRRPLRPAKLAVVPPMPVPSAQRSRGGAQWARRQSTSGLKAASRPPVAPCPP